MFDFKRKATAETAYACSLTERVAGWSYHLMTVEDELDYAPTSSPEMHRYACRSLVRQLAVLLFLPDHEFFQMLQRQENLEEVEGKQKEKQEEAFPVFRLRACLESCLEIFSREAYLVFSGEGGEGSRSESLAYWDKLKEVVLMVLKRISEGVSSERKITLLNGWFLDTVKLLDLCLIFGKNYRTHVVTLLRNVLTRGEELEDFQTDFRRTVDLAFLRLKELSEEFQGFAGIDFAALQEGSHQFQNFRNAEATLTKSLIKTLFSTYDLTCNLQAIADLFPARCRVHLLEHALIFKRFIMIYNKLRYNDEQKWRFGARTDLFRPLIDHLARAIVCFLAAAMGKVAMLIRSLPPESPYRDDLKRTYINFWYFCLLSPAVSYEHRQDEGRLGFAMQHGKELAAAVTAIRQKELFHPHTMQHFKRRGESYEAIVTAKLLGKQVSGLAAHRKALKRMENWKLPACQEFIQKIDPLSSVPVSKEETSIANTQTSTLNFQASALWSRQYDDEPENQPHSPFIREAECFQLSHYVEQEPVQSQASKMERTAAEREQAVGPFELDYSSIYAGSDHFMASGLSDSISEDSIASVSAMLASS